MAAVTTSERIARSLTLLRVFLVASGLILVLGALVLGGLLGRALRGQALDDAERSLTQYTNGVLSRHLVRDDAVVVGRAVPQLLRRDLRGRRDILSVKVWRQDGVLAWTNLEPERIGRQFALSHHLAETLETGKAEAELESLNDEEDAAERSLGIDHVLEVYAPIRARDGGVIGAYEIYADAAPVEATIASGKRKIWLATGGVFLALWALLALLVRGASGMLRSQTQRLRERSKALLESYRRLEENSLEAIASLNATVEAKDPYTAGHSQRVQRVALALGERLGFTPAQLDALRFGALFHDIGKIAVPDDLLTKPERLTYWEYARMKLHSAEGARIVEKFGRLRDAVPIIRHHHERWDGEGYPDGLAGDEIPVEAAVAGLADAWDAMTTDRPYHRALTAEEALAEVRNGRGTQFAPAVVDAFFAVARERPFALRLADAPERAAAAS